MSTNEGTTITSTVPGFNREKLESFKQFAAENPNQVLLGLQATTVWEGRSGESLAKIGPCELAGEEINKKSRDWSIQYGAWKEVEEEMGVEGAQDRIEPVEASLSALCSCVNWAICINAASEGIKFDGLEITAKANVDPRVLFSILPVEEATSCLQSVDVEIRIEGDLSDEDKNRIKEMALRSPVHALVSNANTINTRIK